MSVMNKELAALMEQARMKAGDQYVVNEANLARFSEVCDFLVWLAEDSGGKVKLDMQPVSDRAAVSAEVPLVDLNGDGMRQFVDVLQYMDALNITQAASGSILVDAGVKNVWEAVQ